jgi:hypothetical protein
MTKLLKDPETPHGGDNHSLAGSLNGGNSAETMRWVSDVGARQGFVPSVSTRRGNLHIQSGDHSLKRKRQLPNALPALRTKGLTASPRQGAAGGSGRCEDGIIGQEKPRSKGNVVALEWRF